ncbi:MAG: siderophore-interacting protein [Myxococcota bacterium]
MAKKAREVTLARRETLSPNLTRMTLAGDALSDFPDGFEGGYIKLSVPDGSGQALRSYTIRSFDPAALSLDIDMVSHGDGGPAARWANRAQVGERLTIMGPGPVRRLDAAADWFIAAGDMSALPGISVNLAALPDDAAGYAVIEVISPEDRIEIERPPGIELSWVVHADPLQPSGHLEAAVKNIPWRPGEVSVWVAGEYGAARALRQYFRHERDVPREATYVSCYWKAGDTDEGMKAAKRADPEGW